MFGQITRQDKIPIQARKLHVKSISDGCYAPFRKAIFKNIDGDLPVEIAQLKDVVVTPCGFVIHGDNLIWDAHTIGPKWQAGGESMFLVDELAASKLGGYDPFNQTIYYWGEAEESYEHGD